MIYMFIIGLLISYLFYYISIDLAFNFSELSFKKAMPLVFFPLSILSIILYMVSIKNEKKGG